MVAEKEQFDAQTANIFRRKIKKIVKICICVCGQRSKNDVWISVSRDCTKKSQKT